MENKKLTVILKKEDHDRLKKMAVDKNTNMSGLVVAEILAMLDNEVIEGGNKEDI